jgi:hypothetical protein
LLTRDVGMMVISTLLVMCLFHSTAQPDHHKDDTAEDS